MFTQKPSPYLLASEAKQEKLMLVKIATILLLLFFFASSCSCSRPSSQISSLTPLDQSSLEADKLIVQHIRKAIIDDPLLSTSAKNIKIIAQHGKVVLKGVVNSFQEKERVLVKAQDIVGPKNLEDELTVK